MIEQFGTNVVTYKSHVNDNGSLECERRRELLAQPLC